MPRAELDNEEAQSVVGEFLHLLTQNKAVRDAHRLYDIESRAPSPREHSSHSELLRLQEALEQLAVLSVLARWVDASERQPQE